MAGLEPVIHATAHNILDQGEGPRSNRLVVEVDVQVFGAFTDQFGDKAYSTPPPAVQPIAFTVVASGAVKGGAVTANFTF